MTALEAKERRVARKNDCILRKSRGRIRAENLDGT